MTEDYISRGFLIFEGIVIVVFLYNIFKHQNKY